MSTTQKLITLGQFKTGLESAKSYIDAADASLSARIDEVVADVEGIVATGGEANILEGVKVNGAALPIANKLVDLIIESGTENGTINVNGIDVAVKGLGALAYTSQITEDELSDALKTAIAAKATNADLSALEVRVTTAEGEITTIKGRADALEAAVQALEEAGYQTAAQVETIAKAAVAASGHMKKEVVESLPSAADADENTFYLLMNAETGHYDIYGLIGGDVVLLDDTSVDLSQYSTTEQMNEAVAAAIEALSIGDYAKLTELEAAIDRITVVEAKFVNYYTAEEAEAKFTDEAEAQAIAESAAAAAIENNTATDDEANAAIDEVFDENT